MDLVLFHNKYGEEEPLNNFRDIYFGRQMKYLASDLLNEGLSPSDIRSAVQKAMKVCGTAEIEFRKHFIPIYTQIDGMLINDCKLSLLGYGLVLLNAEVYHPNTAKLQIRVMKDFFRNKV